MSEVAVRVENLSKAYRIGHQARAGRSRYKTLQEELIAAPRRLWSALAGQGETQETVWALKDISFDVHEGEVVGIIGRNGAGKSTLLKILSRITEPTSGQAEVYGRVGSLLEVGTGFHPELTGRENVYLSGAVMGMRRSEISRHFDEIVSFAEIEQFLDTPVKRYSSGMYMRLAFAVAAHLDPEILVVDEVLAVGDAEFQKKCLGKMGDVAKSGRTVLFVSHNMAAVQQLCSRGIVLEHGRIAFEGVAAAAVQRYGAATRVIQELALGSRVDRQGDQRLKFVDVRFFSVDGKEVTHILSGQDVLIRFYYVAQLREQTAQVTIAFNVTNSQGALLTNLNSQDSGHALLPIAGSGYFECLWRDFNLRSGVYDCTLFCSVNAEIVDWIKSAFSLHVDDGDFYGTGRLIGREQGDLLVRYAWSASCT